MPEQVLLSTTYRIPAAVHVGGNGLLVVTHDEVLEEEVHEHEVGEQKGSVRNVEASNKNCHYSTLTACYLPLTTTTT